MYFNLSYYTENCGGKMFDPIPKKLEVNDVIKFGNLEYVVRKNRFA